MSKITVNETVTRSVSFENNLVDVQTALDRCFQFLEEQRFNEAHVIIEQVLNIAPNNTDAHVANFLYQFKLGNINQIEPEPSKYYEYVNSLFLKRIIDNKQDTELKSKFVTHVDSLKPLYESEIIKLQECTFHLLNNEKWKEAKSNIDILLKINRNNTDAVIADFLYNFKLKTISSLKPIQYNDYINSDLIKLIKECENTDLKNNLLSGIDDLKPLYEIEKAKSDKRWSVGCFIGSIILLPFWFICFYAVCCDIRYEHGFGFIWGLIVLISYVFFIFLCFVFIITGIHSFYKMRTLKSNNDCGVKENDC